MEVVYCRAFVFRRRARQRWPNGMSQSGGERWEMSQIGCCLLPRVLLLPILHRAGAHPPPRTRCAPPHPPPHFVRARFSPASRPLLASDACATTAGGGFPRVIQHQHALLLLVVVRGLLWLGTPSPPCPLCAAARGDSAQSTHSFVTSCPAGRLLLAAHHLSTAHPCQLRPEQTRRYPPFSAELTQLCVSVCHYIDE